MTHLNSESIAAIIGVVGTISGTILGYILNSLSRLGEIKIFQNTINISILKRGESGGFDIQNMVTEDTKHVTLEFNIDFYNTSEQPKILRDIKFVTKFNDSIIQDNFIIRDSNRHPGVPEFRHINLLPKEIQNYKIIYNPRNSFKEILNGEWFIEYRTDNNKLKCYKLNKDKAIYHG